MDGLTLTEMVAPHNATDPNDLFGLDAVRLNGKLVALCPHHEGAVLRFVRLPSDEEASAVRDEVARRRQEAGRWPIAERTMQPPAPEAIRLHERRRKAGR